MIIEMYSMIANILIIVGDFIDEIVYQFSGEFYLLIV